jgi:hypothetical protein
MEGAMTTLSKSERSSAHGSALHAPGQYLELPIPIAIAASLLGLLILWLAPPALAMPMLSIVSFTIAITLALLAYYTKVDRRAEGLTLWDVAGVAALIWIGAGMLSEPEHIIQLFGHIMTAQ